MDKLLKAGGSLVLLMTDTESSFLLTGNPLQWSSPQQEAVRPEGMLWVCGGRRDMNSFQECQGYRWLQAQVEDRGDGIPPVKETCGESAAPAGHSSTGRPVCWVLAEDSE